MKISIAMCTFNGAEFLQQQLDSLASQTRMPDEVVICDDGSTDDSVSILKEFIARVPFSVRLVINSHNIGATKNFEKAISLCMGDVIALSDADDVWYPHKLDVIAEVFMRNATAGAVFSDADAVGSDLRPLNYTFWQVIGFDLKRRKLFLESNGFEALIQRNCVGGATMAFRADLRNLVIPISSSWVHDGWIALLVSAVSKIVMIPEPLIKYRQHASQTFGVQRKNMARRFVDTLDRNSDYFRGLASQYREVLDRLEEKGVGVESKKRRIQEKVQHLTTRADINESGWLRVAPITKELLSQHYHRYSNGFSSVAKDLLGARRNGLKLSEG